jgi:hypothetical protein
MLAARYTVPLSVRCRGRERKRLRNNQADQKHDVGRSFIEKVCKWKKDISTKQEPAASGR